MSKHTKTKQPDPAPNQEASGKKKPKLKRFGVVNLSDDKLREFVLALADGRIFTSAQLPKGQDHLLPMIFMPVAMGSFADVAKRDLENIGVIYEYTNQAGPRAINGYPMFHSLRVLNKSDWERARAATEKELERRKDIAV
jgi:hypothetical protein